MRYGRDRGRRLAPSSAIPAELRLLRQALLLKRDVPVLPGRPRLALRESRLERVAENRSGAPRLDDVVDVAPLRGYVGIRELLAILGDELGPARLRVVR